MLLLGLVQHLLLEQAERYTAFPLLKHPTAPPEVFFLLLSFHINSETPEMVLRQITLQKFAQEQRACDYISNFHMDYCSDL